MRKIDFHTHAFADELAPRAMEKLLKGISEYGDSCFDDKAYTDGTLSGLVRLMDKSGVEKSVLLPVPTKASQEEHINRWAWKFAEKTGRIVPFGALFPDNDAVRRLEVLAGRGYKGIKLHGDYQGFYADEPRMIDIYRKCGELGLIIVMHSGFDFASPYEYHTTPEMMARVIDRVSGVRFVIAHMGGVLCEDRAAKCLSGAENVWFDTSYTSGRLSPEKMGELIASFGADRVLFASDAPWADPKAEEELIRAAVGSDDLERILFKNAVLLLRETL